MTKTPHINKIYTENHIKEEHQKQDSTSGGNFGHGQFDSNGQEILHFDNLEKFLVK